MKYYSSLVYTCSETQGTSSPPCGKSTEYLLCPVTQYVILFPLLRKREQGRDIERGIRPIIIPSFLAQITPSYIFANIFRCECTISFP